MQTNRRLFFFPIFLVLFEFSVYIGNDMILPGMPTILRDFHASPVLIPAAMTTYMFGGVLLQWLLGPLSDRMGKRPVLLTGVLCFALACLATLLATKIEHFFALRVIQGMGLCFIAAVGYAAVQEFFDEKTAVKVTALMANVALIAPLIGPLAGAAVITVMPWHATFIMIAALSLSAWVGLFRYMPQCPEKPNILPFSWRAIAQDYLSLIKNRRFILGSSALAFGSLPILIWISQAPMILIVNAGLPPIVFGLWQIPVFAGLIFGNLVIARLIKHIPVEHLIHLGAPFIVFGPLLAWIGMLYSPENYHWLIAGITICSFGEGIVSAALVRLTLFSTHLAKGTAAAANNMFAMFIFALGIEIVAFVYPLGGNLLFSMAMLICAVIFLLCASRFVTSPFISTYKSILQVITKKI